jgi:hypothetical protein
MPKTSLSIDLEKAQAAGRIPQTPTLTATVDAAFDEVINLDRRRRLMQRIRASDGA